MLFFGFSEQNNGPSIVLRQWHGHVGAKNTHTGAVVVAQLVERSLPIPEVRGSNPAIGKNLFIY